MEYGVSRSRFSNKKLEGKRGGRRKEKVGSVGGRLEENEFYVMTLSNSLIITINKVMALLLLFSVVVDVLQFLIKKLLLQVFLLSSGNAI